MKRVICIAFLISTVAAYPGFQLVSQASDHENGGISNQQASSDILKGFVDEKPAFPVDAVEIYPAGLEIDNDNHSVLPLYRQKRATCDLAEGFNIGSSACAAGCILKGFRGGFCSGKRVCICRR